jgi:hypothetical protein
MRNPSSMEFIASAWHLGFLNSTLSFWCPGLPTTSQLAIRNCLASLLVPVLTFRFVFQLETRNSQLDTVKARNSKLSTESYPEFPV